MLILINHVIFTIIYSVCQDYFTEYGYSVIEATGGETSLKAFLENTDRIRLIITDVIVTKKSDREIYEEARKRKPGVKVIFMSGYPADLIQKEGMLEKGLNFISKSSSPQTLLQKVHEVIDRAAP